jgi:hypothetical protein
VLSALIANFEYNMRNQHEIVWLDPLIVISMLLLQYYGTQIEFPHS